MPDHNTPQPGEQQRQEEATQYEQLVASQRKEVAGQTSTGNARDLGTAGGGMIPDSAAGGSGNARGGMGTPEGGATGGRAIEEEQRERGSGTTADNRSGSTAANINAVDQQASQNIGGRTPDQPQTSMGDRDPHTSGGQGTNQNIIDPMTSRAPRHVQDQEEARKAEQKKDTEEQ
ncbi:hypothetical protein KSD_26860 [Ktedonobacter sp. SOSP1-85]|uniref:hypothetical protein n=1 Tax=Ktedonobacter sp. SOSP1-85 TaxID=2778367 RepID=UPI001915001A|nr:hypothetical protein [Ktedonobacter sp. SOSP1-85]GHO74915.1 hypothetical protein KSD_26860 [Ktedonobacter sp. SOSP1-85]